MRGVAVTRRATWVVQQAAVLREELSGLGSTITEDRARTLIRERREPVAELMRVTARSAQRYIDDDATRSLAQGLAFTLADEQPGADLIAALRNSQLSTQQLARLTTALAEAAQSWLHSTAETPRVLDCWAACPYSASLPPTRSRPICSHGERAGPRSRCRPRLTRAARCLKIRAQHDREAATATMTRNARPHWRRRSTPTRPPCGTSPAG